MEIILLNKVANLGGLGDNVTVKSGYARNFLFPQGQAVPATKANVEKFEARRAELEAKLFGSIGTRDIALAITAAGVEIAKSEVKLPTGTLRETGEFEIDLQLHSEVTATIKLVVIQEA